ncbi:hypothetical protein KCU67_g13, partial [Aureobasidium melanogenum]
LACSTRLALYKTVMHTDDELGTRSDRDSLNMDDQLVTKEENARQLDRTAQFTHPRATGSPVLAGQVRMMAPSLRKQRKRDAQRAGNLILAFTLNRQGLLAPTLKFPVARKGNDCANCAVKRMVVAEIAQVNTGSIVQLLLKHYTASMQVLDEPQTARASSKLLRCRLRPAGEPLPSKKWWQCCDVRSRGLERTKASLRHAPSPTLGWNEMEAQTDFHSFASEHAVEHLACSGKPTHQLYCHRVPCSFPKNENLKVHFSVSPYDKTDQRPRQVTLHLSSLVVSLKILASHLSNPPGYGSEGRCCDHTGKSIPFSLYTTAEPLRVQTVNSFLYLGKVALSANANIVVPSGMDDLPMHKVRSEVAQSIASTVAAVDGHPPSLQSMSPERTSLPNDCFTDKQHCCCPHGGKCICIGPKKERPGGNDTSSMKNSHTSGPCTQGEPRSATRESEAQGAVNLSDRSQLLQSVSSAHSQVQSPSILPRRTDAYYEQNTSHHPGDGSARVQDRSQAWLNPHQSVTPCTNNHIPDLSLFEQGYSHFLYDLDNSFSPSHDVMPSSANTFAGMLAPTYQGSGNSSVPTIPPTIAMSDFSATSFGQLLTGQRSYGLFNRGKQQSGRCRRHELQIGFNTVPLRQNGFDVGALGDAESEYERRMPVQPPQSDTICFETTGDTGQFETF